MEKGFNFSLKGRHLVDVQNIFHKMEPRTLKAAYQFYCNKNLDNAHSADADTLATYEVLKAQLDRYQNAPFDDHGTTIYPVVNDIAALSQFSTQFQWVDLVGHISKDKQGRPILNFGKHKGEVLEEVFKKEPAYYDWMMKADFPLSTKQVVQSIWEETQRKKLQEHFNS